MKKYYLFLISLPCIFGSCIKEKQTLSYLKIINTTNHSISIVPFQYGAILTDNIKDINPNSILQLECNVTRGIAGIPVVFGYYFTNPDSLHVKWDAQYSITHLHLATDSSGVKHYTVTSPRNLFKQENYKEEITKDKKHNRIWEVTYAFTEQDYLDAKP